MKARHCGWAGRRTFGSSAPIAATLLLFLATMARGADTTYTGTGWVIGVPVPGLWCTNAQGQVGFRGNAHLVRVQCTDARVTGRRTVFVNGGAQADGSALLYGAAYQEVGTWDTTGTNFTPGRGLWETSYRGIMGADGSLNLHIVGTGWGGTIDGWRLEETLTRAAGAVLDPAIPYNYAGTIKPPPFSANLVLDDFSGPAVGWVYYGTGSRTYTRSNGQLVITGHWPGVVTRNVPDTYALGAPWVLTNIADGQTLESRVDLVSQNFATTAARLVVGTDSSFYSLFKGHDFVMLSKYSDSLLPYGPVIIFFYERAQVPDTNVILSLALTRAGANVVITARVLDKGNSNSVLYARSFTDTPAADPALTTAELFNLSGMNLALVRDYVGAPFSTGGTGLGVWQYNDGGEPPAVAIYDNLQLRLYEIPQLGIERAIRLNWAAPAGVNYSVESAPTVLGPWVRFQETEAPCIQKLTVPHTRQTEFLRLRQAP